LGAERQARVGFCGTDSIESFEKMRNAQVYAKERRKTPGGM